MSEEYSFGSLLTTARRQMGWTQQVLADKLKVSRTTVNRWEQDIQHPPPKTLEQLIAILGFNEKEADALKRAAGQPTDRVRKLPIRNQLFTGREELLEQIDQLLKKYSSVALIGLGGIGKTQLALEFAHRSFPEVYHSVFWVDAADETMLKASYDKILRKLDVPEQHERDQELRIQAVKDWLEDHTNWLLIMDNADDLPLVRSFFPSAHDGRILLTTRTQDVGKVAKKIAVEKMDKTEGQLFLLRCSDMLEVEATLDDIDADISEAAIKVVELLDGHALALDQAGAYIKGGVSLTDYIDHYQEHRRCLLEYRGVLDDDHPESVMVTFKLCFEKACEQHSLAIDILHFCAFLHPDAIPNELFKSDDSFKLDKIALKKGKDALLRYSLMKWNAQESTFSIHRLVQDVLIDEMPADLQRHWRDRVVQALNAVFPYVDLKNLRQCERVLPHALLSTTWSEDELTPTIKVADLFDKANTFLRIERGQYSQAKTLLERALSIYEHQLGAVNPRTTSVRGDLAAMYAQQDAYEQAEQLLIRVLSDEKELIGRYSAISVHNLAIVYSQQGKYEQAEFLHQQVNEIWKEQLGPEHPNTASGLYSLAVLYTKQGKLVHAEALYCQAIDILLKYWNAGHQDEDIDLNIAHPCYGLAIVLHLQGKHKEAERVYQAGLFVHEQRVEVTHPGIKGIKQAYTDFLHLIGYNAEVAELEVNDEP